jgi:hypothetical protein
MQLGKTLVGAIIGGAVGIIVLAAIFLIFQPDGHWLAIAVALLTGLGVRMMVSTHGHASYVRGGLTAILALAIYLVGWIVVSKVANASFAAGRAGATKAATAKSDEAAKEPEEGKTEDTVEPVEQPKAAATPAPAPGGAMRGGPKPREFSPLDFIFLCVAGFIAYELGRGSGSSAPGTEEESAPAEHVPAGTHPDA